MMLFQVNAVSLAKIAKAVRLMAGITPAHSSAGAKLRVAGAPFETFVFVRDEPIVEIDAMGDKYSATRELHEAVSYLPKHRAPCTMSELIPVNRVMLAGIERWGLMSECHSATTS
jgi:hypothetical protein